jgi:WD40 repeat protein
VNAVAFSPDGRTFLSGSDDQTLKLWNFESRLPLRRFASSGEEVNAIAFSPDGRTIGSGDYDRSVKLWDAASGRLLRTLEGHDYHVTAIAFSPDGRTIVSGSTDKTLKLWDVESGRLLRTLVGHRSWVLAVAFSADARTIVSGGGTMFGNQDNTVKLWDAESGRLLRALEGHGGWVTGVAFSANSRSILSSSYDGTLKLWDAESGRELRTIKAHHGQVNAFGLSPDARIIVSTSNDTATLKLWDTESGRLLRTLVGHESFVKAAAFSPDGRTIVSGGSDKSLKLWDVTNGRVLHTLLGHVGHVNAVAFSRDGRTVVSGSADTTIRRWSLAGELLVTSIAASDGQWLTITREGFFDASDKGADLLTAVRGIDASSIDQFYQQLYRPDVVRQKLSMDVGRVKYAADKVNLATILASKSPPEITIVSPTPDAKTDAASITVEADLADRGTDKGGGIGRIEWRVNGVTRVVRDLQKESDGAVTKVSQELALPEGTSVIEMVAYNKANLAASLPAAVSVTSSAPRQKAKLYVLAIGVNSYSGPGVPQLKNSISDAKAVLAAFDLLKSDKSLYENVITRAVFDEAVTQQNLLAEFERLSKDIKPDDVFVLYIAGHGVTDDGRYYLVPHDGRMKNFDFDISTCVGQDQLQQWLTLVPAFKSALIYDTCESGSNTEDRAGFRGQQQLVAAEKLSRSMGRTVLSATSDVTLAQEGYPPDGDHKHGIFTYALLDAFARAKAAPDGRIDTAALADYLREKLPAMSEDWSKARPDLGIRRQEPQVKLSGAPFPLLKRVDIAAIDRVR